MICTLYSHKLGFEKLQEILKESFPKGKLTPLKQDASGEITIELKGGLFSASSKLKFLYRERKQPSYRIHEGTQCPLNENLKGLYSFVASLPSNNESVKGLFLQKIQTLNTEFSIQQEKGQIKNLADIIKKIATAFEAVIFAQPDTVISKSDAQHFLDANGHLIIDQNGNCDIDTLKVNIESKYYDGDQDNVSEEQVKRKEKNEVILKNKGLKVNYNLPFIESESETQIRSVKEIAERITILTVTNSVAFNQMSGPEAVLYLVENNISELLTPKEKDFLQDPTEDKKNQETWKCEGIWTLMWALNIVEDLGFPNEMADLNTIPFEKYPIGNGKKPLDFINTQFQIRTKAEILDANDLYYRIDWACVDARINGSATAEVNSGVVYERHYALNWLIHHFDEAWDDVSCDT